MSRAERAPVRAPGEPALQFKDIEPPRGVDILDRYEEAWAAFPGISTRGSARGEGATDTAARETGSRWHDDRDAGVAFRVREMVLGADGRREPRVEAIRLTRRELGSAGGVRVGDDVAELRRRLGAPEQDTGGALDYLQGGVRFYARLGTVTAIEILRPTWMLREGRTVFIPRPPTCIDVTRLDLPSGQPLDGHGRVKAIDYRTGELRVTLGTADGVVPGTPNGGPPSTAFELLVAGRPLPSSEEARRAAFYTLQVVAATEHESTCVLNRVTRRLVDKGTRARIKSEIDRATVRRLPPPETGLLSVRVGSRTMSDPAESDRRPTGGSRALRGGEGGG